MITQIMPGIRRISKPDANKGRKKPGNGTDLIKSTVEQMSTQVAALMLVEWVDEALDFDRVHFWQGDRLLISLDQVVVALLAGELEIVWTFHLSGSFEEVEGRTRELRYQFPIAEEREEAEGERWQRVLRTGRVRY